MNKQRRTFLILLLAPTVMGAGYDPYRLKMLGYGQDDISFITGGGTDKEQFTRKSTLDYHHSLRSMGYDSEGIAYILQGGPNRERDLRKSELDMAVKYRLTGKSAKEARRLSEAIAAQARSAIIHAERQQGSRQFPAVMIPAYASPVPIPAFKFGVRAYSPLISEEAMRRGIDPLLCNAVTQNESGYNARAVSSKGAMGLMQLMPGTAAALGVRDAFDPRENIQGGVSYLARQLKAFGRIDLALAAYNAGPEAVRKYQGIPPYPETVLYVQKVMKSYSDLKMASSMIAPR